MKVYCDDCKHQKYIHTRLAADVCALTAFEVSNASRSWKDYYSCEGQNRENDCTDFEQSIWFKIKKFFQKKGGVMRYLILFVLLTGCDHVDDQWVEDDTEGVSLSSVDKLPAYDSEQAGDSEQGVQPAITDDTTDTDEASDTDPCTKLHSCGFIADDVCFGSANGIDLKCKAALHNLEQCLRGCGQCNTCAGYVVPVDDNCDYDWIWKW